MASSNFEPPICPITLDVMREPTLCTVDGQTYEKSAIEDWIRNNSTSPFNREPADLSNLVPNREVLQSTITILGLLEEVQNNRMFIIPYEELTIDPGRPIGRGSFKTVRKGTWKGMPVAVSFVDNNGTVDFEAKVLADLSKHCRLIRFYGQSKSPEGQECIISEYAQGGSLIQFLNNLEDEGISLSLSIKINILCQISEGMIEIAHQKYIHRDLAARNILVYSSEKGNNDKVSRISVKIADLGLARRLESSYYNSGENATPLPTRWMAPESIKRNRFTFMSDVYSFAILAWELLNDGDVPWTNSPSNKEVSDLVLGGQKLPRPNECPDSLWDLLLSCWDMTPSKRPSFETILNTLQDIQIESLVGLQIGNNTPNETPPTAAAAEQELNEQELIAQKLAQDGKMETLKYCNGIEVTPLGKASEREEVLMVKALLKFGAKVGNALIACAWGDSDSLYEKRNGVEVAKILIDAGADINLRASDGMTALHKAAYASRSGVIKVLIEAGAKLDLEDDYGATALIYGAAYSRDVEVVKLLIAAGANIDDHTWGDRTAYMRAKDWGNEEAAEVLRNAGAIDNRKDSY